MLAAMTVLLIEHDEQDALLFSTCLQELTPNVRLIRVKDAIAAFDQLNAWRRLLPQLLILLDLDSPDQQGYTVLEQVKTRSALRHVPVVVFSSSKQPEDIYRAYYLYASSYLAKPENLEEYQALVKTVARYWQGVARVPT